MNEERCGGSEIEIKSLKFISVSFKEASLDSPSFRASVNYYHTQIEAIEGWIDSTISFINNKYRVSLKDFTFVYNHFSGQIFPPANILRNGIMNNQMPTSWFANEFSENVHKCTDQIFQKFSTNIDCYLSILMEIKSELIIPYRDCRNNFDYYQSKYDSILNKYQSIKVSKDLNLSNIKDDAFQLFEYRKRYLDASLDMAWQISNCQLKMDRFIVKLGGILLPKTINLEYPSKFKLNPKTNIQDYYCEYQKWSVQMDKQMIILKDDIDQARKQIRDSTIERVAPSKNLNDYMIQDIDRNLLVDLDDTLSSNIYEKSGWLFMKTMVGRPPRTIWVRRWCFLKRSVFGMFMLSPTKNYVEESDKFGILLISVRYDPDQDRKFCFEVKIINRSGNPEILSENNEITLVLQAETLYELKLWLKVFQNAKRRVLALKNKHPEYERAFTRYFSSISEFSCSSTTPLDRQLTSIQEKDTQYLLQLIQGDKNLIPNDYDQFQEYGISTPIMTKMTTLCVISSMFLQNDDIPSALTANFWGSVNWSDFSLVTGGEVAEEETLNNKNDTSTDFNLYPTPVWDPVTYPDFYPRKLQKEDIIFKSLFANSSKQGSLSELLLFRVICTWSANPKQDLMGVCYFTTNYLYFYMNSMGFICLLKIDLSTLVSVKIVSETNDGKNLILKLYNVNGVSTKTRVFFEDINLVAAKIQYLLENKVTSKIKKEYEILKDFQELHRKSRLTHQRKFIDREKTENKVKLPCTLTWNLDGTLKDLLKRQRHFQLEYSSVFQFHFNIPSKGLMHILFGDKSKAFPKVYFLARKVEMNHEITPWTTLYDSNLPDKSSPNLVRKIKFKLNSIRGFKYDTKVANNSSISHNELMVLQQISKVKDEDYYEIDQKTGLFMVPFAKCFYLNSKFIIISNQVTDEKTNEFSLGTSHDCCLFVYYDVQFVDKQKPTSNLNLIDKLAKRVVLYFCKNESLAIKDFVKATLRSIGEHGKVVRSIQMGGQITVIEEKITTSSENVDLDKYVIKLSKFLLIKLSIKWLIYNIVNIIFFFIRLLFALIFSFATNLRMINRLLLFYLLLSVSINLFLVGKISVSYWSVRKATTTFNSYLKGHEPYMRRALSIKDIDLLSEYLINEDNICYRKFLETSQHFDNKYKKTRHELAVKRNEIMVELKILNSIEKELVSGDYRDFLLNEIDRCNTVKENYSDVWSDDHTLLRYCGMCQEEINNVSLL